MTTPIHHRLLLVTAILFAADPAAWASNIPGPGQSSNCGECEKKCPDCGTATGTANPVATSSLDWQIYVGLARYPKPTTYTGLAQALYDKDGNLPNFSQMLRRYFPATPLQQSQVPLKISQTQLCAATFHPSCLFLESEANIDEILRKTEAGSEYIHQILTGDAFTLVELVAADAGATPAVGSGWRIRVWKRNAVTPFPGKDGEGFYLTGDFDSKTALADVTFRHLSGSETDYNTLIYTQNETTGASGTRTISNKIVQTLGANGDNGLHGDGKPKHLTSQLFDGPSATGSPLSTEILDYSDYGPRAWDYTITRSVFTAPVSSSGIGTLDDTPPSNDLTSQTVEEYIDFSNPDNSNGGEQGAKRLMSYSQSGEQTTYTYVTQDATNYGRLASVTRPDGSWTAYSYVAMDSAPIITEYSSWGNLAIGDKDSARKTETEVSGTTFTVKTLIGTQLVAKSQTTLAVGGGTADTLVTTWQWDGTGNSSNLSAANSLTTTTAYFSDIAAANPGLVHWIEHPDGTATIYSYGPPPDGSLPAAVFATTTRTGAGSREGISAGTETVTTYGLGNIPIEESTKDIATGVVVQSWATEPPNFDAIGRPITRVFNGNSADFETSNYDCCGLGEFRARDGSTTHYYRDKLKRVYKTTTTADSAEDCPVVTTNTSISGLTTSQTRTVTGMGPDTDEDGHPVPHPSDALFLGSTTRSLDGLTTTTVSPSRKSTSDTDRLSKATAITHDPAHATGDTVTTTAPTGITTTTHFRDGRTNTVTDDGVAGDAITNVTYAYAANTVNGGFITTATTPTTESTELVSETHTDALGRTVKTVSPTAGTTTYTYFPASVSGTPPLASLGSLGKLKSVTDDDDVTTSYGYNAKGERDTTSRSIPAVDGEETSVTAIQTTTTTSGVADHGTLGDCYYKIQNISSTYGTSGTSGPFLVSGSYTSFDGISSVTETPTGATWTDTTRPDEDGVAITTTIHPDSTKTVTTITHGLTTMVVQKTSDATPATVSSTTYDYDSLQRLLTVTDSRTGTTTYGAVNATVADVTESGQPLTVTNPHSDVTGYSYDVMGRVIQTTLGTSETNTSYYPTGRVKAQWGSQTYPTFRVYNEQGQIIELHTWQAAPELTQTTNSPPGSSTMTGWLYYADTGLLQKKTYPDGPDTESERDPGAEYTYTPAGRLATRIWARGGTTTYGYLHGFLTSVAYTNPPTGQPATPDVAITYDTLGRKHSVTQASQSQIKYSYADASGGDHAIDSEIILYDLNHDGDFNDTTDFTRVLDRANRSFGRGMGFTLGTTANHASDQTVSYAYIAATGQFQSVATGTDTFTYGYTYTQTGGGPRVGDPDGTHTDFMPYTLARGGTPALQTIRTYGANRDVLAKIENYAGTTVRSSYTYTVNDLGQRTGLATTFNLAGTAVGPTDTAWGYDSLGQVTAADLPGADIDRKYDFDTIGNRLTAATGTYTTDENEVTTFTAGTNALTEYFGAVIDDTPSGPGANALNQYAAIKTGNDTVRPVHDDDGNMTHGPLPVSPSANCTLVWDAENRLIEVKNSSNVTLVKYAYDALSRRIASVVGTGETAATTLYIYDGWNCIAEYTGTTPAIAKQYFWGLDISGTLQGAGGVGGLLAVNLAGTTYYPTFDGNGNVSEYLTGYGVVQAHFEYDPFGNTVVDTDDETTPLFSYRFSTKPLDFLTGLYYYGYRWYDPLTGRWPSRDPIGERYGLNLYEMCYNNLHAYVDRLGWEPVQPTPVKGGFGFSGWQDHDSGKSDDGNFKDRAGGRENTNVGSGLTGKDLFEHMKKLTKDNCCILDFRIAGHGWANSPNGRGDGIPSSHAGDEEGFNIDKTTGRPSTDGDVRDLKDLESEKAKGTIRFCLECTISIFACRISDGFIKELARISGCKVTAAAGACRKNQHGTGWESNADFPGDTNQFRQSDGGSEPTDAGHIFTPPPIS